jgi:hypothetical protein
LVSSNLACNIVSCDYTDAIKYHHTPLKNIIVETPIHYTAHH